MKERVRDISDRIMEMYDLIKSPGGVNSDIEEREFVPVQSNKPGPMFSCEIGDRSGINNEEDS